MYCHIYNSIFLYISYSKAKTESYFTRYMVEVRFIHNKPNPCGFGLAEVL